MTSGTGTCAITATRAADANYNVSSPSAAANVTIGKASQTITFGALAGKTFGDLPFGVSATASSGLAVAFSAGALDACTVNVSTVTVTAAGSCTITATQAGDNNYAAAPAVPQTFVIAKATPSIQATGATVVYDGNPHPATGTATGVGGASLGPVTLTYTPGDANAPVNAGSYSVVASIASSANYNAATSAPATVTITQADAVVSVTGYSGVYDGNPHGATGTATGVKGESLTSLLNLGGDFTNVPGGTATWTFAGDTNYKSASGRRRHRHQQGRRRRQRQRLQRRLRRQRPRRDGHGDGCQRANPHRPARPRGSLHERPGRHRATGPSPATRQLQRQPRGDVADRHHARPTPTVIVSGYSGVYDGNAHGATGTATGVDGVSPHEPARPREQLHERPGRHRALDLRRRHGNYNDTAATSRSSSRKADATVTVSGYSGVYDGNAHGATGTATGVGGVNRLAGLRPRCELHQRPGRHGALDLHRRHATTTISDRHVAIVISKADATVSVSGYSGVYDGNAHGATGTATGVQG